MVKRCLTATVWLGVCFGAATAHAGTSTVVYTAGNWQVANGVMDDQRSYCAIISGGAGGRRVIVQAYSGDPNLTLQMTKDSWSIPQQTPIEVVIDIDGNRWSYHGFGTGNVVGVSLPPQDAASFEQAFRAGRNMTISFPGGTETPWAGGLTSSNAVFNVFRGCVRSNLGSATQPYAAQPNAAQPAAVPGPSQPYAAPTPAAAPQPPAASQPMPVPAPAAAPQPMAPPTTAPPSTTPPPG